MSPKKIPAAVLAATGAVGQRFIQLLENHPWFEVIAVTGSARTSGQNYGAACRWVLPGDIPANIRNLKILPSTPDAAQTPLVFSALPSGEGFIVTNPNCTSTGITVALKALQNAFGLRRVFAASMQAISGAGYPGVPSLNILGNVIPYIAGEEEKASWEPRKMLGKLNNGKLELADIGFSFHANRVPVIDGHTVVLTVELADPPVDIEEAAHTLSGYQAPEISRQLPSAPQPVIQLRREADRPQPRLDLTRGMTTVVGRVRPDDLFDLRMVVVSHNTIRGAAGGSIYNAELLVEQGFVKG
ncbi:MAG: hypothetical protein B6I38_09615 [Anaerolineaceae bacterium 4572_5.1]|nr:MAG: hypothetical protein B6I38_09615 [Anaerolineaceae bacterium 4572_5.1]